MIIIRRKEPTPYHQKCFHHFESIQMILKETKQKYNKIRARINVYNSFFFVKTFSILNSSALTRKWCHYIISQFKKKTKRKERNRVKNFRQSSNFFNYPSASSNICRVFFRSDFLSFFLYILLVSSGIHTYTTTTTEKHPPKK